MRLLACFVLLAPALALADGCDLDSPAGVKCGWYASRALELRQLIDGVGSVKELRARVEKAHASSVHAFAGNATRGVEITFDARGRFLSWDGIRTFTWDDHDGLLSSMSQDEKLTLEGTASQCTELKRGKPQPTATCTVEGKTLRVSDVLGKREFTLVDDGWKGADGKYDLRRDTLGRVVLDEHAVQYQFSARQTVATFRDPTETGFETKRMTWTLNADGLPIELRTPNGVTQFVWTKPGVVRVIDGTCAAKKECPNPRLAALVTALTEKAAGQYTVERGEPPSKLRTATELWYQPGKKLLAEQVRAQVLEGKVLPENVKEWTWGGPFDVLVIVGP